MIYDWYNIFNLNDFNDTGLVSQTVDVFLTDVGYESILITKGNKTSMLFRDTFLPVNFEDHNPYTNGVYAVYSDQNDDVWLGIEVPEDTQA